MHARLPYTPVTPIPFGPIQLDDGWRLGEQHVRIPVGFTWTTQVCWTPTEHQFGILATGNEPEPWSGIDYADHFLTSLLRVAAPHDGGITIHLFDWTKTRAWQSTLNQFDDLAARCLVEFTNWPHRADWIMDTYTRDYLAPLIETLEAHQHEYTLWAKRIYIPVIRIDAAAHHPVAKQLATAFATQFLAIAPDVRVYPFLVIDRLDGLPVDLIDQAGFVACMGSANIYTARYQVWPKTYIQHNWANAHYHNGIVFDQNGPYLTRICGAKRLALPERQATYRTRLPMRAYTTAYRVFLDKLRAGETPVEDDWLSPVNDPGVPNPYPVGNQFTPPPALPVYQPADYPHLPVTQ